MLLLYGRHYGARYQAIAELIPNRAQVLDVCCGPAVLFHRYLRTRDIDYLGLDISSPFIRSLQMKGGRGQVWDAAADRALPAADMVVMQASLYHFLPRAEAVIERMMDAARRTVIIAEPVRNLVSSSHSGLARLARRFTSTDKGDAASRFTEPTLDGLFARYSRSVIDRFPIPGGREVVYVLRGRNGAAAEWTRA
jgi:hypothetical protein